jgi:hypothetical protein
VNLKKIFRTIASFLMLYLIVQGTSILLVGLGLYHLHRTYNDWIPMTAHVVSITPPATAPKDGSEGYYSSVIQYIAEGSMRTITQAVEGAPRYKQGQDIEIKYAPGYANNYYIDDGYDFAEIIYFLLVGICLIIFPAFILLYMHKSAPNTAAISPGREN